ncbi:rRNA pseudouridine synthase [Mumia sp. ZJ1417]|uniref:pseudouridine synthase n=1 Tax=unclassified Mumia TaxID=2621872 RepID=UPI0014220F61|nr:MULTISPECIES: pseudouridine synthase [unclassified Mumia]QMW68042.1 rRNA pseudouridine synthase [Mumia sp. ZJ1417]
MSELPEGIRLQKVLAQAGVGSRRACEILMERGRVSVNGEVVTQMGRRVDPRTDVIHVDGKRIPPASDHVYLVLNKPRGVVSTMSDEQGRPDLSSYAADRPERLFHVGRLDTDTSGLLLLTNDGEFANRMAHPSFEITKTYVAEVEGQVARGLGRTLRDGITLDDGPVQVDRFVVKQMAADRSIVELDIHLGRNRIVRRMLDAVGHPVVRLTRTGFGGIHLGGMKPGDLRELTSDELGVLLDSVGL